MNDNMKKWVEALESGEYLQTRHQLLRLEDRDTPSYCCLGVACVIYRDENGDGEFNAQGTQFDGKGFEHTTGYLPGRIAEWTGITDQTEAELVNMNDREGADFHEIATYLRKEYA